MLDKGFYKTLQFYVITDKVKRVFSSCETIDQYHMAVDYAFVAETYVLKHLLQRDFPRYTRAADEIRYKTLSRIQSTGLYNDNIERLNLLWKI